MIFLTDMEKEFSKEPTEAGRQERLEFLKRQGVDTGHLLDSVVTAEQVKSNIENFLGTVGIPVGLAGPLHQIDGKSHRALYTGIATTEGALVASLNRGVKAINRSGGFDAVVTRKRMLRIPCFTFQNIHETQVFNTWILGQLESLQAITREHSKFGVLKEMKANLLGRVAHITLSFETGDASGQNMTTVCAWHICLWVQKTFNALHPEQPILEFLLDGNTSADKKISYASIQEGRGTSVTAECVLTDDVLEHTLKTSTASMLKWYNRTHAATILQGTVGYNINIANVIAGIFTATGQDIACVHESSVGLLFLEKHERGVYFSLTLPRLVVGTVGGGTGLPQQRKMLELSQCYGLGKVDDFAKLIAGFCLALEVSTSAAMISGQFAQAHDRLGRNRPTV
jgi:hydroxymethylglutaryl-CoA reductase (NADPH)